MVEIEFYFRGSITSIQSNFNDSMKKICMNFAQKVSIDLNNIFFCYNGNKINMNLKCSDVIKNLDKERKKMSIVVNEINDTIINTKNMMIKANYPICPKCLENSKIQIKDYKINIFGCAKEHITNNILLEKYEDTQKINISKIICQVCNANNKSNTYNNEFYLCNSCQINLCPLCKEKHEKKHNIVNWDLKDFYCKEHNDLYYSFCQTCKKNLCIICENAHNNHEIISYGKLMPNVDKLRNKLNESRDIINKFKNDIKEVIFRLNKVMDNIDIIYNINNNILNNFIIKNRNIMVLENINNINSNLLINDIININEESNIIKKVERTLDIYNEITNINSTNDNETKYLNDSKIIRDGSSSKMIKNWIAPDKNVNFTLLYRATRDGDSYSDFHSKCKDAPNISFIKLDNGRIIGGYTTIPWIEEDNCYIPDKDAFIFSIDSKEKYDLKKKLNGKYAIYHKTSLYCCCYGYCGDDLAVHENFLKSNESYCCGNGIYKSFDTNNLKMIGIDKEGTINIGIKELEVYKVNIEDEINLGNNLISRASSAKSIGINESKIITDLNDIKMIRKWIEVNNNIQFQLLYRATRDGDSVSDFHSKCHNESPTIAIIKTENGRIIGGFTTIPWLREDKSYISDKDAFIFSIDSKEKYNLKKELNGEYAIYHSNLSYCCCFGYCGDDLAVGNKFLKGNNSYCCGNGDNYYSFQTDNNKLMGIDKKGKIDFKIIELEIFKINY